ncbi:MAG: septum site-determining protein MinD [Desulfamplus sp.]|nr:septum site-determining protein MinD [Desulfamplus sp.]MBF0241620.1 septum site-determining protein MinD [Desulfamplus sp.]
MEGRIIVVTSGKGGVGKTTATASIGAALALEGNRVAVIDMDIGLRNLDVVLGLENRIVFNIVDVVNKRCNLSQALIRDRRIENLFLVPASQSDNKDVLTPLGVQRVAKQLKSEFDYVIMDSPAGIEKGFENSVVAADEAIVICTPDVSSIRDADRVIGLLYARSITPRLVVNRIIPEMVARGDMLSHEDVMDVLSIDLLGLVPMDDQVVVSTNTGMPLVMQNQSLAGQAFRRIAKRINGEPEIPIQVPTAMKTGFWSKITQKLGLTK